MGLGDEPGRWAAGGGLTVREVVAHQADPGRTLRTVTTVGLAVVETRSPLGAVRRAEVLCAPFCTAPVGTSAAAFAFAGGKDG
jgi:hypothetical protein